MPVARYRCIALRRTGGLTAMRLEVQVDLSAGEEGAADLARLLQGLDLAALARGGARSEPLPDAYRYDLEVDAGDGREELAFGAGAAPVPPELRPVIRLLERRALDALRARRPG
jgi:hypothetical protein